MTIPVSQIDPNLIHTSSETGSAATDGEAIDDLIGKVNEMIDAPNLAAFYGLTRQAADPTPVGVDDYLWMSANGSLRLTRNGVTTTIVSGDADLGMIGIMGNSNAVGRGKPLGVDWMLDFPADVTGVTTDQTMADDPFDPPTYYTKTGTLGPRADHGDGFTMGIEIAMGQALKGCGLAPHLVKYAISGSNTDHWHPTGTYPTGTNLFTQAMNKLNAQRTATGKRVGAIVWFLGENDAYNDLDPGIETRTQANLTAIMNAARVSLGEPDLLHVLVNLRADLTTAAYPNGFPQRDSVRASIAAAAAADSNAVVLEVDDLLTDDSSDPADNGGPGHYISNALATIGYRSAHLVANLLGYIPSSNASPRLLLGSQAFYHYGTHVTIKPRWDSYEPYRAGDLGVLVTLGFEDNQETTLDDAQGFVAVGATLHSVFGGTHATMRVFTCIATSNAMLAPTLNFGTSQHCMACIFIVRGANATTPVEDHATYANNNVDVNLSLPSVTTTEVDRMIFMPFGTALTPDNSPVTTLGANANLTGLTLVRDLPTPGTQLLGTAASGHGDYNKLGLAIAVAPAAGAIGATTANQSGIEITAAWTLAITPA